MEISVSLKLKVSELDFLRQTLDERAAYSKSIVEDREQSVRMRHEARQVEAQCRDLRAKLSS